MKNPKVGCYVEFDISDNSYNAGNIKSIDGDKVLINQKEEVYFGVSYPMNRLRERNWVFDTKNGSMML